MMRDSKVVLRHGGYKRLISYQKSVIVFDATRYFCDRFLSRRDRTYDQMIQAARSGKQNIIEGSQASGTSKEMELKLTSVARAILEELLEDYLDFLRGIGTEAERTRATLSFRSFSSFGSFPSALRLRLVILPPQCLRGSQAHPKAQRPT